MKSPWFSLDEDTGVAATNNRYAIRSAAEVINEHVSEELGTASIAVATTSVATRMSSIMDKPVRCTGRQLNLRGRSSFGGGGFHGGGHR